MVSPCKSTSKMDLVVEVVVVVVVESEHDKNNGYGPKGIMESV